MIKPSPLILWLMAGIALLLLGAAYYPALAWAGLSANVFILGACRLEARQIRRADLSIERRWPPRVQIHQPAQLLIVVENRSRRALEVGVRQLWPASVHAEGASGRTSVRVAAHERVEIPFEVTPTERGKLALDPLELEVGLPWGLARRQWQVDEAAEVTVFPDLRHLWVYEALRRSRALRQFGVHQQRMVGAGHDFDQLREYLPDDDYRHIDWKATARRNEPITTVYQAERSRDVLLCMDCGRMMGDPVQTGTALDRAVDTAILLAHASVRQGDRVGLMRLSDQVELALKPAAGSMAVRQVIEGLIHARPKPVFPSYPSLVREVRRQQSHRSLLFVFTNLSDPQLTIELARFLPLLSRRHMLVVVGLQDPLLNRTADGPAREPDELYRVLAARKLLNERQVHRRRLAKAGVHVVEADSETVELKVINAYLSIKSRQLL